MSAANTAIGLLEVNGISAAMVGADAMLKAAVVDLVKVDRQPGLLIVVIAGAASDVKAALECGAVAADQHGRVSAVHLIADAHPSLLTAFRQGKD